MTSLHVTSVVRFWVIFNTTMLSKFGAGYASRWILPRFICFDFLIVFDVSPKKRSVRKIFHIEWKMAYILKHEIYKISPAKMLWKTEQPSKKLNKSSV